LYSLLDVIFKDLPGTMKKVSEIGYKELETFSYGDDKIFGIPFSDFVTMTSDLGMKIVSGHYSTGFNQTTKGNLRNDWEKAVSDAKAAGQEYSIIAWMDPDERKTLDDYKRVCELINKAGEMCKQYGVRMGYHNHDFEFEKIDDQVPYDVMLAELDPSLVCMELDLYWIIRAGYSPDDYFKKYPSRFELWHVKDMHKEDRTKNADIGTGSINFIEIFKQQSQSGMKHFFVEQETFETSSMASVENGFRYLSEAL
jgi:sugar phosphate isomerase/epimerase